MIKSEYEEKIHAYKAVEEFRKWCCEVIQKKRIGKFSDGYSKLIK